MKAPRWALVQPYCAKGSPPPCRPRSAGRNQTQPNATKRNEMQPNATIRNQMQRNATIGNRLRVPIPLRARGLRVSLSHWRPFSLGWPCPSCSFCPIGPGRANGAGLPTGPRAVRSRPARASGLFPCQRTMARGPSARAGHAATNATWALFDEYITYPAHGVKPFSQEIRPRRRGIRRCVGRAAAGREPARPVRLARPGRARLELAGGSWLPWRGLAGRVHLVDESLQLIELGGDLALVVLEARQRRLELG